MSIWSARSRHAAVRSSQAAQQVRTEGSVVSENPAHNARVTAATSRRPRYWFPLITTVGSSRIFLPLMLHESSPCAL